MTRLGDIKARVEAATDGPWAMDSDFGGSPSLVIGPVPEDQSDPYWTTGSLALIEDGTDADAAFIAHARTDIPDLLAVVEAAVAVRNVLTYTVTNVKPFPHWCKSTVDLHSETCLAMQDTATEFDMALAELLG